MYRNLMRAPEWLLCTSCVVGVVASKLMGQRETCTQELTERQVATQVQYKGHVVTA